MAAMHAGRIAVGAGSVLVLLTMIYSTSQATDVTTPQVAGPSSDSNAGALPTPGVSSPITHNDVASQRAKWRASGISSYQYELYQYCFCGFLNDLPITMTVVRGQSASMSKADGSPVAATSLGYEPFRQLATVESIFDEMERFLTEADATRAALDPEYGFPVQVDVDYNLHGSDDEATIMLTEFRALRPSELPGTGGRP